MNNRQAGAYRELVRKEERAREKWNEANLGIRSGSTQPLQSSFSSSQQLPQATYNPSSTFSSTLPLPPSNIPQHAIYDQAIRISSPRLVEDDDVNVPRTIQRRVIRQVEVPYTREVKVPVKTRKIIPVTVQKKVRTAKLVEVPSWTTADEEYTEIVDEPAIRQREIWVKKLVPEKYMKKTEIKKTRKVKVPTTVLKNVDDYEIVEVTENQAVEVDGYRIDRVEDSKLVEVEEYQTYELHPHATGDASVLSTRDIGPVKGMPHHSRKIGNEVYHPYDARTRNIDVDEEKMNDNMNQHHASANFSRYVPDNTTSAQTARGKSVPRKQVPAPSSYDDSAISSDSNNATFTSNIGFKVKNSNANGVVVSNVIVGESGDRAGIHNSDIIMYANNKPTRNLTEFRSVVNHSTGPMYLQVKRRGGQKLLLTVQR